MSTFLNDELDLNSTIFRLLQIGPNEIKPQPNLIDLKSNIPEDWKLGLDAHLKVNVEKLEPNKISSIVSSSPIKRIVKKSNKCKFFRKVFNAPKSRKPLQPLNNRNERPKRKCSTVFPSPENIKRHKKPAKQKTHHCKKCHQKFDLPEQLKKHSRLTHPKDKKHCCLMCGKSFSVLVNLQIHFRTHTGERPYTCEMCHKRFSQLGNLQSHIRIHTREKLYNCEICKKGFIQVSQLQSHKRARHTREEPYQCDLCGKKFVQLSNLQQHQRTHGRQMLSLQKTQPRRMPMPNKTYDCTICPRKFTIRRNLKEHLSNHYRDQVSNCKFCKGFCSPDIILKKLLI